MYLGRYAFGVRYAVSVLVTMHPDVLRPRFQDLRQEMRADLCRPFGCAMMLQGC